MKSIVEQLKQQSTSAKPMVATTVRIEQGLEFEIRSFCKDNHILPSVVLRKAIELGFNVIKIDHDDKSSR